MIFRLAKLHYNDYIYNKTYCLDFFMKNKSIKL